MAGNTKLVGFSPRPEGVGGVINLERLGEKVVVEVSEESLGSIRDACMNLPSRPPQVNSDGSDGFKIHYDESMGRILVDMDPGAAKYLAQVLGGDIEEGDLLRETDVRSWVHHLRSTVKAHEDYHNVEGEPGVEDSH